MKQGVTSVILTDNGNVYTGVCIDTSCSLGMCAERNTISNMITNGESKIIKLVCVGSDGLLMMPCGACREYMMQLHKDSYNTKILTNLEKEEIVILGELCPKWWGTHKFEK